MDDLHNIEHRKQQLVARGQHCRETLEAEWHNLKSATAWVPTTVHIVRAASPILLVATPLLGYFWARRRPLSHKPERPQRRNLIAYALAGYKFFRQIKPIWDALCGVNSARG